MNELLWRGLEWPVIAISTGVELSVAIEAMKLGAIDFLVKPIERIPLTKALTLGWSALDRMIEANENRRLAQERVARLTAREIGISSALLSGQPNKAVAFQLGISVRTVEMHRAHIMAKLGVKNLAEAALIVAQAGFDERPATVRQDRRQQLKPPETVPGGLKGPFFPPGAGPHPAAALTSMRRKDDSAGRRAPARK
jgi:DNA-binding NarL/FixJ family response regulator